LAKAKTLAPEATGRDASYLRDLRKAGSLVRLHARGGQTMEGHLAASSDATLHLVLDSGEDLLLARHDLLYMEELIAK
jgi:hypothetical protein